MGLVAVAVLHEALDGWCLRMPRGIEDLVGHCYCCCATRCVRQHELGVGRTGYGWDLELGAGWDELWHLSASIEQMQEFVPLPGAQHSPLL